MLQTTQADQSIEKFYHGTKAFLKRGDLIEPGFNSNYGQRNMKANFQRNRKIKPGTSVPGFFICRGGRITFGDPIRE